MNKQKRKYQKYGGLILMSEIEKMYENAIGKQSYCTAHDCLDMSKCENCYFCKRMYPSSTAEKQLKLIKWLAHKAHNGLLINKHITDSGASMVFDNLGHESTLASSSISFKECLAKLVNNLWQDLTEEERKQIKEILK